MIHVVDLFAGAGGASTGMLLAAQDRGQRVRLTAVNHWPEAVETHTRNHPEAQHFCASIETLDPRVAVPGGRLDVLIAAPECVFHSTARGGKPIDDQRRASAWHIMRWLELLRVDRVLIENVPEFVHWGPLGANNRPLKSRRGEIFRAFIAAIEAMNYRVEWKVLNAADYGAATTRRRLFIQARLSRKSISWPAPSHSKTGATTLFGGQKKWRGAREIIDWSLPSQSIFTRKKPLKPATMRRILEGLRRFSPELEPFLVLLRNNATGQSVDAPVSTLTAGGGHHGLVEPVLVQLTHGGRVRSVDHPLPTVTTAHRGECGVAEPFIVPFRSDSDGRKPRVGSMDDPLHTITTENPIGLAEAFLVQPAHGSGGGRGDSGRVTSLDSPVGTVPASNRFALVEPFIITPGGPNLRKGRPTSEPLPTVCGGERFAVVEPFVLGQQSGSVPREVADPLPTVAAGGAIAVVEPFIVPPRGFDQTDRRVDDVEDPLRTITAAAGHTFGVVEPLIAKYNRTAVAAKPVTQPLDTISTRDRYALVQPVVNGYVLDIRFRMLQPHELAAAMSFPKGYQFTGTKGDRIRMIGNAIDCRMSQALCTAILDSRDESQPKSRKRSVA